MTSTRQKWLDCFTFALFLLLCRTTAHRRIVKWDLWAWFWALNCFFYRELVKSWISCDCSLSISILFQHIYCTTSIFPKDLMCYCFIVLSSHSEKRNTSLWWIEEANFSFPLELSLNSHLHPHLCKADGTQGFLGYWRDRFFRHKIK